MVIASQKDATDKEDGEIVKKCSRCDYTETTVIPKPTQALTESSTQAPIQSKTEIPTQAPTQAKTEKPKEVPTKEPKKSEAEIEQEFKEDCDTIEYETLARNPDKYKGNNYKFTGKVKQVVESSWLNSKTTLLIDVTETKFDYIDISSWSDSLYCTVKIPDGEDRILEDDILTFWGTCDGMYTYTSVLGQSITVPRIDIEYFELN